MDFVERCRTCGGSIAADNVDVADATALVKLWQMRHTCAPLVSLMGSQGLVGAVPNFGPIQGPAPTAPPSDPPRRCAYVYGGSDGRCHNNVFEVGATLCWKHTKPQEDTHELSQRSMPGNLAGFAGFGEVGTGGSIEERPGRADLRGQEPKEYRAPRQDRMPPTQEPSGFTNRIDQPQEHEDDDKDYGLPFP